MPIDIESLYRRHGPMVLRRCRALLRDEDAAVDAMHDTFVRLMQSGDRLDERAPSSLLYRTATHVCLNRLRSQRRHLESPDVELLERIADAQAVEPRLMAFRVLTRLFAGEKDSTRTLAVLHLHDGLTLEEVAAAVGLSVSGVRKRLRTLRASLQELEAV